MIRILCTASLVTLFASFSNAQSIPSFQKLMITEVSWAEPEGVELTNFSSAPVNLSGWTVLWDDGVLHTSLPLSGSILPGRSILVVESNPASIAEAPPGTVILQRLPSLSTSNQQITVALRTGSQIVHDEVHVSDVNNISFHPGFGGTWRGVATRGSTPGSVSVERYWGLDSDSGADWTAETTRSFGLENQSGGPRGTDTLPTPPAVLITELDDYPDYVEINNRSTMPVSLQGWELVLSTGGTQVSFTPFAFTPVLQINDYLVLGNGVAAPPEMPPGTPYVNMTGTGIDIPSAEFELALYDHYGRLIDLVRCTGHDDKVVHNHPRAPSRWSDFVGAAERMGLVGDGSVARRFGNMNAFIIDNNRGSDWRPMFTRSMGSTGAGWIGGPGLGDELDVRVNGTAAGGGMTIVLNAGSGSAGHKFSFLYSIGHLNGTGPLWGLGADALNNWAAIHSSPFFSKNLGVNGEARVDLPSGALPPGLQADVIFILQDAAGLFTKRTAIIKYDT